MSDWIKVCNIDSLKPGVMMDFDFNDKKILLVNINNKIFASDRICYPCLCSFLKWFFK